MLRAYVAKTQPDKAARRVDYPSRVFWVARLLFVDADGGSVRCPAIGHFGVMIDEDSTNWPLYPLAVIAGVPFEVADGISLNGRAERPESYLDEIEGSVVVRRHFMRPADNPLEAANQLFKSDAWKDVRW
ncbi:MAG: hypothetical protein KDB32_07720, partial [Planctomycetes bacterium]|nr:hypothetical protein [Planctomycetota bacterium]